MTPRKLVTVIRTVGEMSQVEVAKATGIPQSTISKIERGKVADIKTRGYQALHTLYCQVLEKQEASYLDPLHLSNK